MPRSDRPDPARFVLWKVRHNWVPASGLPASPPTSAQFFYRGQKADKESTP